MSDLDDEGRERKRRTKAQQQADRIMADWRWLLSDERGRRLVLGLLDHCETFGTGVTGTAADYHRAGRRDVGVHIFNHVMRSDPEAFLRMTKERESNG